MQVALVEGMWNCYLDIQRRTQNPVKNLKWSFVGSHSLTTFSKNPILDVLLGLKCNSDIRYDFKQLTFLTRHWEAHYKYFV